MRTFTFHHLFKSCSTYIALFRICHTAARFMLTLTSTSAELLKYAKLHFIHSPYLSSLTRFIFFFAFSKNWLVCHRCDSLSFRSGCGKTSKHVNHFFFVSVEILKSKLLDVDDFIVETSANYFGSFGEFLPPTDHQNLDSSNKFADTVRARNACEGNVVYHKFNVSARDENEKVSWNWTIKNIHETFTRRGENSSVTFR